MFHNTCVVFPLFCRTDNQTLSLLVCPISVGKHISPFQLLQWYRLSISQQTYVDVSWVEASSQACHRLSSVTVFKQNSCLWLLYIETGNLFSLSYDIKIKIICDSSSFFTYIKVLLIRSHNVQNHGHILIISSLVLVKSVTAWWN